MNLKQFRLSLTMLLMVGLNLSYGQVTTFPYEEDFESGNGEYSALGTNSTWELGTPASPKIQGASSGSYAWVTDADGFSRNEDSFLQTRIFDFSALTEDPVLLFSTAYNINDNNSDGLTILMSTDGGIDGTYHKLGSETDPIWYDNAYGFVGNTDGKYKQLSHVLTGASGKSSVLIRFAHKSSLNSWSYDGVAIDDVKVLTSAQFHDLAITNVQVPEISPVLTDRENMTVTVRNLGQSTMTLAGLSIQVHLNGESKLIEHVFSTSEDVTAGQQRDFVLEGILNLSAIGNYHFNVTLQFDASNPNADHVSDNNAMTVYTGKMNTIAAGELPIKEDFMSIASYHSIKEDQATIGELNGTPGFFGANGGQLQFGGFVSEGTLYGINAESTSDLIYTMDLSSFDVAHDQFRLLADLRRQGTGENDYNGIFIRGSVDDVWLELYDWHANLEQSFRLEDVTPVALGNVSNVLFGGGQQYSNTFQIRIGKQGYGFLLIQKLAFNKIPPNDVKLMSIDAPGISASHGTDENISLTLANIGTVNQSSVPVTVKITTPSNEELIFESLQGPLNVDDTTNFALSGPFDFSVQGNYDIQAFIGLESDVDTANDTLPIINSGKIDAWKGGLPFSPNFESLVFEGDISDDRNVIRKNVALVPGLQSASFTTNEPVTGGLYGFNNTTGVYLVIKKSGGKSNLVFTVDLSEMDAINDSLVLKTTVSRVAMGSNTTSAGENAQIFIRGSENDPWLSIYNWGNGSFRLDFNPTELLLSSISKTLIDNGQQFSESFQIKYGTEFAWGIKVDQLFLFKVAAQDAEVVTASVPGMSPILGAEEKLSIAVKNTGFESITNLPVNAKITTPNNTVIIAKDTIRTTVASGESVVHEFTGLHDFSIPGEYLVQFYTSLEADGNTFNDSTQMMVTGKITPVTDPLPFIADFTGVKHETITKEVVVSFDEIPGASFQTSAATGYIQKAPGNGYMNSDAVYIQPPVIDATADLIFTLDLSNLDVAKDELNITSRLATNFYSTQVLANNKIFMRGSASDEWIVVYTWGGFLNNSNSPSMFSAADISSKLSAAGQQYSQTFQVRFGTANQHLLIIDDVKVQVTNNTAPIVANAVEDQNQNVGFGTIALDLSNTFSDDDGDVMTLSAISSDESIVTATMAGSELTLTEIASGHATITVKANDGKGGIVETAFTFNVNNQPTVVNPIDDLVLTEGFGTHTIDLTNVFSDADGDELFYSLNFTNTIIGASIEGKMLTITEIQNGTAAMEVGVHDGKGGEVVDNFQVVVEALPNQAPTVNISIADQTFVEGFGSGSVDLTDVFADADDDILTYSATASNAIVAVSISGKTLIITEAEVGTTEVTVTADDGKGGTASDTFTVNIEANGAPEVNLAIEDVTLIRGFGIATIDLTDVFSDPENDELIYTTSTSNAVVSTSISNKILTITEAGVGSVEVTVTATDDKGGSTSDIFLVSVNEVPNTVPEVISPVEDFSLEVGFGNTTISLTAVFSDADQDLLNYSAVSNTNVVTLSIAENVLTINEVGLGTAQITVTADDGKGGTVSDVFELTVLEKANNSPVLVNAADDQTYKEGFGSVTIDLSDAFTDADQDVIFLEVTSSAESVVTAGVIENTLVTLTEKGIGEAEITVFAHDGNGGTATDLFKVLIVANNAPEIANAPAKQELEVGFTTLEMNIEPVFIDDDNDQLSFEVNSSNETVATASISQHVLTLTEGNTEGSTTITLTASDGLAESTVTFEVSVVNVLSVGVKKQNVPMLFPNPVPDGMANLSFDNPISGVVRMSDFHGRLMLTFKIEHQNEVTLDVNDFLPGVYLVEVSTEEGKHFTKLIKR